MKRLCAVLSLLVLFVGNVSAVGLGGYLTGAAGQNIDYSSDRTYLGLGLVLDTAVEKDELFNYRLSLGYNSKGYESGSDQDQFALVNSFGFGILRNDGIRLWLGPEVEFSFSESDRWGSAFYGVGIGPVIGANVHLSDLLSLSVSVDALYQIMSSDNSDIDSWDEWKVGVSVSLLFKIGDEYLM